MLIRAFRTSDIPALLSWFPTPVDLAQWGSPARRFPLDDSQVQDFLDQTIGDDPQKVMWVAERQTIMVATATTMMDWHQGVALLGFIAVAPSMRGNGVAEPFLRDVVTATYKDERIARIELNVYTFNHGAIRTYEKLGFVKEGVRRSLAKMGDERWDAAHYSLLRAEFERWPVILTVAE